MSVRVGKILLYCVGLGLTLNKLSIILICDAQHTMIINMIKSFKHKGLRNFFEMGDLTNIQSKHMKKLRLQLAALDTALVIEDMDLPGYRLHKLKGDRKNCWSITVNGNWRITFEFEDGDAYIVNYEDYH